MGKDKNKCEHGRQRSKKSARSLVFARIKRSKSEYIIRDPAGYIVMVVWSNWVYEKEMSSQKYLGCDINSFKKHIEEQFLKGMTWKNLGKLWYIDRKIPLTYKSVEEVMQRLHYKNTQPMFYDRKRA